MSIFKSYNIAILGLSTAVPKHHVDIDDYQQIFDKEVVEKFKKKTGIKGLYRTHEKQTASDLGYIASEDVIKKLGVEKDQIGILVFVSQAPDYRKPATACVLQHRLGLSKECACFDVNLGCSGFMYGNQIMQSMMMTCDAKYGLLIVADTSSKLASNDDKSIGMMFGDAGAAIIYERKEGAKEITLLKSDGDRYKSIIVPAGGFREMYPEKKTYITIDGKEKSKYDAFMDGLGVFTFSITDIPQTIKEYLTLIGKSASDFEYMILHQANHMIIGQIAKKFKMPKERVPLALDRFGNTSGVSIPITLCDTFGDNHQGLKSVLVSGFGIGLSWGVTSFETNTDNIFPIIYTDSYYSEGFFE